jgi:hypothetical protein
MPRAAPRRHSGRARAVAIASSPYASGSRTQQAEPAPTPKTRAAPFAPPFSDTDRPYAWPPPSEFEFAIDRDISVNVARNPGRGQPAGRSGRFGGPAAPPLVHSRRRRRARREGAGLAISAHCLICIDHDHDHPAAGPRPRAPKPGTWTSGGTSRFREGPPNLARTSRLGRPGLIGKARQGGSVAAPLSPP